MTDDQQRANDRLLASATKYGDAIRDMWNRPPPLDWKENLEEASERMKLVALMYAEAYGYRKP